MMNRELGDLRERSPHGPDVDLDEHDEHKANTRWDLQRPTDIEQDGSIIPLIDDMFLQDLIIKSLRFPDGGRHIGCARGWRYVNSESSAERSQN